MDLIKRCQIVRPISKRRFNTLVKAIRAQHPWLAGFKCEPSPGHLALIAKFLNEMETLFSNDALYSLGFLHIRSYQGKISVHYRLAVSMPAEEAALLDAITGLQGDGFRTCAVCGQPFLPENRATTLGFCNLHPQTWAFFAEDIANRQPLANASSVVNISNDLAESDHQQPTMTVQSDCQCEETVDIPEATEASTEQAMPIIPFLDPAQLQQIKANIQGKSKEQFHRLDRMLERIISSGGDTRQLAILPHSWRDLIDDFEAAHPNFYQLAELLRDHFALASLGDGRIQLPPIVLVGEPGIGKTVAANLIAELLQLPFKVIDMASAQTNSVLAGSDSFWSNAHEGSVFETLAYQALANPIILLDELDKAIEDPRANSISALYQLLEPSSARAFQDLSVREISINASHINWIACANSLEHIPQPILSRMTILKIPAPTSRQIRVIAANLYRTIKASESWGDHFADYLSSQVIEYLSEQSPRILGLQLKRAFGIAARAGRTEITMADMKRSEAIPAKAPIGFITSPTKLGNEQGAA